MTKNKATVTKVSIGNLKIEGLMDEQGKFYVAVPQMATLTQQSKMTLSRDIKRLLGGGLELSKMSTEFTNNKVNCLTLPQFEQVIIEFAMGGNKPAQKILRSLVGLSLAQLFSDAFCVRFQEEDRQQYLIDRGVGVEVRRDLTDAIKDYLADQGMGDARGYYATVTNQIYLGLSGMTAHQIREQLQVPDHKPTRDYLGYRDLRTLAVIEGVVMNLIDSGTDPLESVKLGLGVMRKSRLTLTGNGTK